MKAAVILLACLTVLTEVGRADPRQVNGSYSNSALGFSISIPRGLTAIAGDQAGPERGVRILLPLGSTISVYGEPNSLGWKDPADGIESTLGSRKCALGQKEASRVFIGHIAGAQGRLACGDTVEIALLAFRPGGGPVYCLLLATSAAHEKADRTILTRVAATFRIIRWK